MLEKLPNLLFSFKNLLGNLLQQIRYGLIKPTIFMLPRNCYHWQKPTHVVIDVAVVAGTIISPVNAMALVIAAIWMFDNLVYVQKMKMRVP